MSTAACSRAAHGSLGQDTQTFVTQRDGRTLSSY
jgi:hypothetical protein